MTGSTVLQVAASASRRGAEVFAVDLHHALETKSWTVRTVALTAAPDGNGLDLEVIGGPPLSVTTLLDLRRRIRESSVVVAHGSAALPAVSLASVATRGAFVYRSIGDPRYWQDSAARRARVRAALARARRVVALWPQAADALTANGVPPGRIAVIPNGVPSVRYPPVDGERRRAARTRMGLTGLSPIFVYLGSLSHEKGVDVAVRAMAGTDGHLVVVGAGPDRASLEALARAHAPDRVHFMGSTDDPASALAAADAVVLPSRSEGMAAVLIEAGLSEVPVVATDVGAVREVVVPGESGTIVPADDPAALAHGLRAATLARFDLGAARTRCLRLFDIAVVADAWNDVLVSACG